MITYSHLFGSYILFFFAGDCCFFCFPSGHKPYLVPSSRARGGRGEEEREEAGKEREEAGKEGEEAETFGFANIFVFYVTVRQMRVV